MMGEIDWFGQTFGAFPEGMIAEFNRHVAKAMIRAGLAVVLIERGGKKPVCTLSTRDRNAADTAAKKAARERGAPNWAKVIHDCGLHHALTEEKQLNWATVKKHLESGCNLAVSFKHSTRKVIVVDLDTDDERRAFLAEWASQTGDARDLETPLTVTSPGVFDPAAEVWRHKNGGHLWLDVPEDFELPARPGKAAWCACHHFNTAITDADGKRRTCPHAFALYWGSSYVLVPPSVRKEGPYRVTGGALPAPAWLLELVKEADRGPAPNLADLIKVDDGDPINVWSVATPWSALMTDAGYVDAGLDNCGCPMWSRPGATNLKSATTHEVGCARFDTSSGHGVIHAWSDALRWGGKETVSKLNFVAWTWYGGDVKATMDALGIKRTSGALDDLDVLGEIPDPPRSSASSASVESTMATESPGKGDAPRAGAGGNAGDGSGPELPHPPAGEEYEAFWNARPVLRDIHDHAWSMFAAPWAALGGVLAYVTALTPPRVKVNDGSLNLFAGLVGPPGAGKNAAIKAARTWVGEAADRLYERGIGSGQGIEGALVTRVRDPENEGVWLTRQIRENILVQAGEIDQLTAHSRQQASTLIATLRSAWQAEPLGGMYKDATKDLAVGGDTYRMSMIVGIQPGRARALIEDATGGLPQRFLWMPTTDPAFPENPRSFAPAEPWKWKPPVPCRGPEDPFVIGTDDGPETAEVLPDVEMGLCERALAEIDAERAARTRGTWTGDEFATHDTLGRLKVAAALALLDGRTDVSEEDWDLAGVVTGVSQHVRTRVIYGLEDDERKRREAERAEVIETSVAVEKAKDATALETAAARIYQAVARGGTDWQAANRVRKSVNAKARTMWDEALAYLVDAGHVERREIEGSGTPGVQVRLGARHRK